MITFASPAGLLLLALIPLLLLFRRRRALPRRLVLAGFFLLEALRREEHRTSIRFLRMSRALRLAVVAAALACLSLALAGTGLVLRRFPPERWLLVVDNVPQAAAAVGGEVVAEAMRSALARAAAGATRDDLVTVMTTSPAPALRTFSSPEQLRAHLAAIAPAARSGDLAAALAAAGDLAGRHERALLLSPRAGLWRERIRGARAEGRLTIPDDAAVARGNRGFALARVRASAVEDGRFDIFAIVRSSLAGESAVPVRLAPAGPATDVPLLEGRGALFLEAVALEPGRHELLLPGGDAFPGDDRVRLELAADEPLAVAVPGDRGGVLAAAVGSHPGYRVAPEEEAEVEIRFGEAPPHPPRPTLLVYPRRDRAGLRVLDLVSTPGEPRWHPDHAVTRALRGGSFRPEQVVALDFDEEFASLADTDGAPFLLAGEQDGKRLLVWAFDPLGGRLFARPEFVMLLRESLDWLGGRTDLIPAPEPDARATEEAAELTRPRPEPDLFRREKTAERRMDLVPWLVAVALLLGTWLAAAEAFGTPADEGGAP